MEQQAYRAAALQMLSLVRCAVSGTVPDLHETGRPDPETLFQVCQSHGLTACTAYALEAAGICNAAFKEAKEKAIRKNILMDADRRAILARLLGDGAVAHRTGLEALYNALHRLYFLQGNAAVGVRFQIQQASQRMGSARFPFFGKDAPVRRRAAPSRRPSPSSRHSGRRPRASHPVRFHPDRLPLKASPGGRAAPLPRLPFRRGRQARAFAPSALA